MLWHHKCTAKVICAVCTETIWKYNNLPSIMTVKMVATATALRSGKRELIPPFNFYGPNREKQKDRHCCLKRYVVNLKW